MMIDDLLVIAEELATRDQSRPQQASLRRAVSTAYYALFHAVCFKCTDRLVGMRRAWELVSPVYRSIDHGTARRVFREVNLWAPSDHELASVGRAFVKLQEYRVTADYDLAKSVGSRSDVLELIGTAREAIAALWALPNDRLLLLAVQFVRKQR